MTQQRYQAAIKEMANGKEHPEELFYAHRLTGMQAHHAPEASQAVGG